MLYDWQNHKNNPEIMFCHLTSGGFGWREISQSSEGFGLIQIYKSLNFPWVLVLSQCKRKCWGIFLCTLKDVRDFYINKGAAFPMVFQKQIFAYYSLSFRMWINTVGAYSAQYYQQWQKWETKLTSGNAISSFYSCWHFAATPPA